MGFKRRNKVNAEFNMSSLTDIIFLLLIFFMLTSTLVSPNALNLKLPTSSSKTVAPASISVSIKRSGKFYVGKQETSSSRLRQAIQKEVRGKGNSKEVTIVINAERRVPIEHVVQIMDIAMSLRVNAILATEQPK